MVASNDEAIVSVFPPVHKTGQAAVLLYRRGDPLVVDIILWGRSNQSTHRTVLRSDLLTALTGETLTCGDTTLAWVTPRYLRLVVQCPDRTVVSILSARSLIDFIEESIAIVPASEEAETEVIGRLARDLISAS